MHQPAPHHPRPSGPSGHLLVDRELRALLGRELTADDGAPVPPEQVQASSMDLRLGPVAVRVRAGFLPDAAPIEARLADLEVERLDLTRGARLERGAVYLVPLMEHLALPTDLAASSKSKPAPDPRSTTIWPSSTPANASGLPHPKELEAAPSGTLSRSAFE